MKYEYGEFDGQRFLSPDELFPSPKMVQFILQHGQDALDALNGMEDQDMQEYIEAMVAAGLLERDEDGNLRMTSRMLRGIESRALLEIFEGLKRGSRDAHPAQEFGRSAERSEGSKAYEFGDPINEIDLTSTLRNTLRRQIAEAGSGTVKPPLKIRQQDFEVFQTESQTDTATCVLIDLSGSMMRWGRFFHAKRVALGMAAMIRSQFPLDTIDFVGFSSLAERIDEKDLPLVMPKPVTIHDYEVNIRVPLEQAEGHPDLVPQHFTNLHMGLRLSRQILAKRGAANKQVFIITDGQPTAHIEAGPTGDDMLYLLYPPTERTTDITLKEALRCQQQGIRVASFALIEDYYGMDWVGFIDKLTKMTRGIAYYCASDDLSSTVIESYLSGKKSKSFID